jgi:hypothetical protein
VEENFTSKGRRKEEYFQVHTCTEYEIGYSLIVT